MNFLERRWLAPHPPEAAGARGSLPIVFQEGVLRTIPGRFFLWNCTMESLKGHFLVASPHLLDPNFARTVVLMIHHSEDGAFGVVINRPADKTIRQIWERATEQPCAVDRLVNVGGPVSGPLIAVHTDAEAAEMQVIPGLYFSAQREHLERLVERDEHPFRLFVGHSGWGKGQLERELEQGAWFTTPATVEDVFDDEVAMWRKIAGRIGSRMLVSALNLKDVPPDASLN